MSCSLMEKFEKREQQRREARRRYEAKMSPEQKEAKLEQMREWRRRKKLEDPSYSRDKERTKKDRNPRQHMLNRKRANCKYKGIEFDLTEDGVIWNEVCPYEGVKIDYSGSGYATSGKATLDRIDPTKGYVNGNVEVISDMANRRKQDHTIESLERYLSVLRERSCANIGVK